MCGRFYTEKDLQERLEHMMREEGIFSGGSVFECAGGDVFPSDQALVVSANSGGPGEGGASQLRDAGFASAPQGLRASAMTWGFTNPYSKSLVINVRAESALDKPMFSDSIRKRRCVIPASGFYEWDRQKARYRFDLPEEPILLLAGFYRQEAGQMHFTILTTQANDSMAPIHDRMPVTIRRSEMRPWILDDARLQDFLTRDQVLLTREQEAGQISMQLF